MATSVQSIAWRANDRCHVSVATSIVGRVTSGGRRHLLLYPALMSLGAGMLASCAVPQAQPPSQTAAVRRLPAPADMPALPRETRRPARKPSPPTSIEGAAPEAEGDALAMTAPKPSVGAAATEPSPPPSGRAGSPPPQPSELIGLDQSAATRLFGPAAERSEEPPATVWRYKNGSCELDLFFYLDLRSGNMRTLHYAFKGNGTDTVTRQDCLRSLLARGN